MKEAVDKIAAASAQAGVAKQFAGRFDDVPHQFTRAMQDEAFAWLDQHLAHQPHRPSLRHRPTLPPTADSTKGAWSNSEVFPGLKCSEPDSPSGPPVARNR
jgi:hypothetical protein